MPYNIIEKKSRGNIYILGVHFIENEYNHKFVFDLMDRNQLDEWIGLVEDGIKPAYYMNYLIGEEYQI
jgi:hypothetical protein